MAYAGLIPRCPSSPFLLKFSSPRSTIPRQSHSSKNGAKIETQRKFIHMRPSTILFNAVSSHSGIGGIRELMPSIVKARDNVPATTSAQHPMNPALPKCSLSRAMPSSNIELRRLLLWA